MTREQIYNTLMDNYSETIRASREIYKLHLEEKLYILEHFRTTLISEGCPDLADEYFEQVEELQQELKSLENEITR